ncbi:MAG TPA: tRNA epoxyqueuosine(34) reductase QueG [Tepidisphaeraceae bacterium]|nr:tRNA epoxyqueuosine(34) reductase QueG [Tepidisphaeraceae bacterium]
MDRTDDSNLHVECASSPIARGDDLPGGGHAGETPAPRDPAGRSLDRYQLGAEIKRRAHAIGFDLVGITTASPSKYRDYFRQWLDDGQAGTMHYLARRFDERTDPATYLPGARSVVCVALNYHAPLQPVPADQGATHGRVARYALGIDYHEHIKSRLYALADGMRQLAPDAATRCGVDTAPIMEKELAARAGIGWIGKNTCVINPVVGSWLLLGEVITTLDLPHDEPGVDRCGTCTRCLDACPTGAINPAAPYQLDARKCISYLTIEHRDEIDPALQSKFGDWLYGCDVCQDVCPWNGRVPEAIAPVLEPRFKTGTLDAAEVRRWGEEEYRSHLRHSAMKRVKLPVLQRNATIVLQNKQPRP